MTNTPIPTLAAYLRDSGGDTQELSIDQQKSALLAWATQNGYIITRWFVDAARPGSSTVGRDGFQQMMSHFRHAAGEQGIVVWNFSRFSRDIDDSQFYKSDLRRRGYKVLSASDNIPDSPEGRFFEAALDWMNDRYLDDLAVNIKRGLASRVSVYGAIPGTPPPGFMRQAVQLPPHRDGSPHIGHRWVPNPATAPLVQTAFAMRVAGHTVAQINAVTRFYKNITCYKAFFTNRIYIGILDYAGQSYPAYCEPIVDTPTWDAVQRIIARYAFHNNLQSSDHPRRQNSPYLLSGLVFCARCGSFMSGDTSQTNGKQYRRYRCNCTNNPECDLLPIHAPTLETAVIETITGQILAPENVQHIAQQLQVAHQNDADQLTTQRSQLATRLSAIRRRIANITDTLSDVGKSRALTEKLAALEADEATILAEIAAFEAHIAQTAPIHTRADLANIAANLIQKLTAPDPDPAQTRAILRGIIARVIVDRIDTILTGMITYYSPPADIAPISQPPPGAHPHRRTFTTTFSTTIVKNYHRKRP